MKLSHFRAIIDHEKAERDIEDDDDLSVSLHVRGGDVLSGRWKLLPSNNDILVVADDSYVELASIIWMSCEADD
jgi:hypothetical protein